MYEDEEEYDEDEEYVDRAKSVETTNDFHDFMTYGSAPPNWQKAHNKLKKAWNEYWNLIYPGDEDD